MAAVGSSSGNALGGEASDLDDAEYAILLQMEEISKQQHGLHIHPLGHAPNGSGSGSDGGGPAADDVNSETSLDGDLQFGLQEALLDQVQGMYGGYFTPGEGPLSRKQEQEVEWADFQDDAGQECEICQELQPLGSMLYLAACAHSFCLPCLAQHGKVSVEARRVPVPCPAPGCGAPIQECELFLEEHCLAQALQVMAELSISETERFFCPYKDCSMLMVREESAGRARAQCNGCQRSVCAQCGVPWHEGATCEEFQAAPENERDPNDFKLKQLAHSQRWLRCPRCGIMVERNQGCPHMTCRCKAEFCYGCGKEWVNKKATCRCFGF